MRLKPESQRAAASREPDSAQECRAIALLLLARREHSFLELRHKLERKGYEPKLIDDVLRALDSEHLLSDERFAEVFVRSRINKGFGPARIRHELGQRGVSSAVIDSHLDHHDWNALASDVRRKRFGNTAPGDYRERAKQARFLNYRGFTSEQTRAVLATDDWD